MLKPEHVTTQRLLTLLKRAYYAPAPEKDGWVTVREGMPCVVNIRVDAERQFIRFYTWFGQSHLDETEIAAAACRLNANFFLVKFIASKDTIAMSYELPFAEGLNPATFIRIMRRFAKVTADAFETLPKPLADTPAAEKRQQQRLH